MVAGHPRGRNSTYVCMFYLGGAFHGLVEGAVDVAVRV